MAGEEPVAVDDDATAETAVPVGSLLARIPGTSTPRVQALKEFEDGVADLRRRYDSALWPLVVPKAEGQYRWRIQLECGYLREVLTRGEHAFPDERSDVDPLSRSRLPAGEYWCPGDHEAVKPYREIVDWVDKEVKEFAADPEEPQHDIDRDTWAKIRRTKPRTSALWTVKLACGHLDRHVVTDVGWKPEDGPRLVSRKRRDEMLVEFEEYFGSDEGRAAWPVGSPAGDHVRKMLALRWPMPQPDRDCFACTRANRVTGYQRIGWLMPRSTPKPPQPTEREKAEARLAAAEAEVERLRRELDEDTNSER